jgi:carboxynorspermidine decarboxylase
MEGNRMLKTPVYVIDESILRRNLEVFKSIKDQTNCSIILALKAYATYATFPLMREYLDGCTSSSLNEAILGREEFGKSVHIYSPGYTHAVMEPISKVASHMIFNSHTQLETFMPIMKSLKPDMKIGLRLNPEHSEVEKSIYNPCAPCSRFGVTKSELDESKLDGIDGVLVHALCGHGSDALERLMKAVEEKFADVLHKVKWVDFGGGHMVTQPHYDRDLLVRIINDFQNKYNVTVILEPGEAMVVNAGTLETTVVDILKNDMNIAIIDSSATAHMPDVLEMPYRPRIKSADKPGEKAHTYRIGSTTCLSGDVIGDYSFDEPLKIGDRVIFEDMAQYTMVKNTTFNGIDLPNIAIKRESGDVELVKEFGYEDFKRRL